MAPLEGTSGVPAAPAFGQGYRYEGTDTTLLAAAIEAAFDYRGDVTLLVAGGAELKGYLSNRDLAASEPFVEILQPESARPRRLRLAEVRGVVLHGKDPASGKSWETWVKNYKANREAEARGETVAAIGLFPEPLD